MPAPAGRQHPRQDGRGREQRRDFRKGKVNGGAVALLGQLAHLEPQEIHVELERVQSVQLAGGVQGAVRGVQPPFPRPAPLAEFPALP